MYSQILCDLDCITTHSRRERSIAVHRVRFCITFAVRVVHTAVVQRLATRAATVETPRGPHGFHLPGFFDALAVAGEDWVDCRKGGVDDTDLDFEGCQDGAGGEIVGEVFLA